MSLFEKVEKKKPSKGDVLIVDDDPGICEILKQYCENMGCFRNILVAADGSIAATKMRNQKFSLMIFDMKLPKKSGLDLIRELDDKSINQRNCVLVVSGTLDKTVIEKVAALGVRSILPKPFDENIFQERVLKVLGNK